MNPPVMLYRLDRSTLDLTHVNSPLYFHLLLQSDRLKVSSTRRHSTSVPAILQHAACVSICRSPMGRQA